MLEPTGHHVLILPDTVEKTTASGIYLPEETRQQQQAATVTGKIIAIGKQAWVGFAEGEPWAKVGDKVFYAKYGGCLVTHEKKEFRLVNDEDIVAIIKEDV